MVARVRWGVIGTGAVCEVKSVPALQQQPGFKVSVACRRDLNAAQDFVERHAIPHALANHDELIASPLVDVVYIATPPSSHLEIALKVAATNKPCTSKNR